MRFLYHQTFTRPHNLLQGKYGRKKKALDEQELTLVYPLAIMTIGNDPNIYRLKENLHYTKPILTDIDHRNLAPWQAMVYKLSAKK